MSPVIPIDPIIRARTLLSVEVNGLQLAPPEVPGSLQRFCRPLAFWNHGDNFELSFSGTCLLFRQAGRNLLLCTRHQLTNAGRRPDEIVMVVDDPGDRRVGINPDEVSQVVLDPSSDPAYADLADIMIAEYTTARPERDLAGRFLNFDLSAAPDLRAVPPGSVDATFCIGYPTSDTSYNPRHDEDWNLTGVDIVSRWSKLYLKKAEPTAWDAKGAVALEPARPEQPILDDPDGISGAPVFFLYGIRARQPRLGFAGIVVRGNRLGRLNMIEAAHIRQALELHFRG